MLALLFVLVAALRASSLILQIASKASLWQLGRDAPPETTEQLVLIDEVAGLAGLLSAFGAFLLVAAAFGMLARWVLTHRDLPRSAGWLSAATALAYVVGRVGIAAGQLGVAMLARDLAMGLATPIWALWFAHHPHPGR